MLCEALFRNYGGDCVTRPKGLTGWAVALRLWTPRGRQLVQAAGLMLFEALYAFFQEHGRCSERDGGVEGQPRLDTVYVRRCTAGAHRGVRLGSRQPSSTETSHEMSRPNRRRRDEET
jgi:hypothetical protein